MGDKNLSMSDCFVAGIRALRDRNWIKKQQKEIAKEIGYTECHLAQVMNGKREPGISLQDMLAKIYGMNAEDVIRIGRSMLEGKGFLPFIGQVEHLPANSEEQARVIIELTNRQYGIEGLLQGYMPQGWDDFLARKITCEQLYDVYANELELLIKRVRNNFMKR